MEAVDVRGRFVWHQLLTRDVPGARKFYPSLTGWNPQPWPTDPSYTVCVAGEVPAAGMMAMTPELPADMPPHWMQYIGTRDVDATAEAARVAGGSIIRPPSDMRGAGRYAVLADPQGAVFAIIDPENARAEGKGVPPVGHFSWHELATTDNEAAFAFYSNLFGWDAIRRMDMGGMGVYLIFGYGGEERGGMYIKAPSMPGPAHWLPYVRVPSVDAAVPVVEAGGGKVIQAPMDVPGGRIAVIHDPTGAAVALHSNADSGEATKPKAAAPKTAPKTTPKTTPKPKTKAKPKARPKVKAKAKAKPAARKNAPPKSKSKSKAKGKTKVKPGTKARTQLKAKAKAKGKARARPKARKKLARRKK